MPIETRLDGDPGQIYSAAGWLQDQLGFEVRSSIETLRSTGADASGGWSGSGGMAFSGRMSRAAALADTLHGEITSTAGTFNEYADQLASAQSRMASARETAAAGGLPVSGTVILEPVNPSAPDYPRQVAAYQSAAGQVSGARASMTAAVQSLRARQSSAGGVPLIRSTDVVRSGGAAKTNGAGGSVGGAAGGMAAGLSGAGSGTGAAVTTGADGIAGGLSAAGAGGEADAAIKPNGDGVIKPNDGAQAEIRDARRNDDAAVAAPSKPAEGDSGQAAPNKPAEGADQGTRTDTNGAVGERDGSGTANGTINDHAATAPNKPTEDTDHGTRTDTNDTIREHDGSGTADGTVDDHAATEANKPAGGDAAGGRVQEREADRARLAER
ncbi:hypothetical protein [Actinoplanes sp. OR16]|uniref:hypothetical protein n=1 Tax=Actinoplanes sp. OR16 TaxID=946334 RepID=UPI000FDB5AF0|nr:hypothetical protein [Actinoplanes sp. OR16]